MESSKELLYVLIPCLNEEANVRAAAESVFSVAEALPVDVRVILIDDGSTDRTRAEMREICLEHPQCCELIAHDSNRGMGLSVMKAYDRIPDGAWVHVTPGDNELDFAASIRGFLEVRHQYDVILGYLHNAVIRPMGRRFASFGFSKVVGTLYGFPYRYLNGFKVYRVEAFRHLDVVSQGHAFFAELLAKALLRKPDLRIGEVPFYGRGRAVGHSKAIRPSAIVQAIWEVFKGARSVARYREKVIKGRSELTGEPATLTQAPGSADLSAESTPITER